MTEIAIKPSNAPLINKLLTLPVWRLREMYRDLAKMLKDGGEPPNDLLILIGQVGFAQTHPLGARTEGVDHESLEAFTRRQRPLLDRERKAEMARAEQEQEQEQERAAYQAKMERDRTRINDVPAGRYAVRTGPDSVRFYKVDKPTEGRWAGYTFVSIQAGDEEHPLRNRAAREDALSQIGDDVKGAMELYGQELGACGHCGRTLTNDESRARGIGPVCASNMGW